MPRYRTLGLAAALALALPSTAAAAVDVSVVDVEGQNVVRVLAGDEANTLNVGAGTDASGPYVDVAGAITSVGAGCGDGPSGVRCQTGTGSAAIALGAVFLGGGDDRLNGGPNEGGPTIYVEAGPGADNLIGSTGPDVLLGQDGNDWIEANNGVDGVDGGAGDDTLYGESSVTNVTPDHAADELVGGPGNDKVGYSPRAAGGVTVSLDGQANDGLPGEGDQVDPTAESVEGTAFDDHLSAGSGPAKLDGWKGNDTLTGGGANDVLLGGDGSDTLNGGAGADTVQGGFGDDRLDGGPGADSIQGDTLERDVIAIGSDTIEARDGTADTVDCGIGADVAHVDAIDIVAAEPGGICETLDRAAGGASGAGGSPSGTPGAQAHRLTVKLRGRATRARGVSFRVKLARAARVTITLKRRVGKRYRRVGRVRVRVKAGTRTVRVKKVAGKRLKKGRYRATLSAPGLTSATVSFRVRR